MKKAKELILYIVFGVLTTVVSMLTYSICNKFMNVLLSNIVSWIFAVAFAYVTNKLFVFESKSWNKKILAREIPSFAGARLATLGIEEAGIAIMITWLSLDLPLGNFAGNCFELIAKIGIDLPEKIISFFDGKMIVKLILQVVVVILNYIFSKLVIFRNKNAEPTE